MSQGDPRPYSRISEIFGYGSAMESLSHGIDKGREFPSA